MVRHLPLRADDQRVIPRRRDVLTGLAICAAWDGAIAQTPSVSDGPYVWPSGEGRWVARWARDGEPATLVIGAEGRLEITGVGRYPAFDVVLRPPASSAAVELEARADAPCFILADTHGEFEITVEFLQRHGVIGAGLEWTYGDGRLIVLGDILDRGPHHLELLWLFYRLEAQAAAAGGDLNLVLGNHETMVLRGDLRYLHPRHQQTAAALDIADYSEALNRDSVLGQWLRSKPAMLRVGDMLFLHGGVSPELLDSGLTLSELNDEVRQVLSGSTATAGAHRDLVMRERGPLWYRGYFPDGEGAVVSPDIVDRTLDAFNVRHVFVGHTIVPEVACLYECKVVAVQVYPARNTDGRIVMEAAMVDGDGIWRARADGGYVQLK